MLRIVMYDIKKDKPRTKLAAYLEQQGLTRMQYSVFSGELKTHHWKNVWIHLKGFHKLHCQPEDKIYSFVVDADLFRKMSALGPGLDIPWILNEVHTLYW